MSFQSEARNTYEHSDNFLTVFESSRVLSSTAYNMATGDDFFTVLRGLAESDMKRAVNSSITEFSNGFGV